MYIQRDIQENLKAKYTNLDGRSQDVANCEAKIKEINKEIGSLVLIIRKDVKEVYMRGGTKAGLIIGLMLSLGGVIGALLYVRKIRKPQFLEYDEGGEHEDHFKSIP